MLNPMSLLIMLDAIPQELSCWGYACLDLSEPTQSTAASADGVSAGQPRGARSENLPWPALDVNVIFCSAKSKAHVWPYLNPVSDSRGEGARAMWELSWWLTERFLAYALGEGEHFVVKEASLKRGRSFKPRRLLHHVGKSWFYNTSNHLKQGHDCS